MLAASLIRNGVIEERYGSFEYMGEQFFAHCFNRTKIAIYDPDKRKLCTFERIPWRALPPYRIEQHIRHWLDKGFNVVEIGRA